MHNSGCEQVHMIKLKVHPELQPHPQHSASLTDLQLRCDDSFVLDGQDVRSRAQQRRRQLQQPVNVPQSSLGPLLGLVLIYQLIGQQIRSVVTPTLGLEVVSQ